MILSIDTADSQRIKVVLKDNEGKEIDSLVTERKFGSQVLVSQIAKILKRNKIVPKDLKGIEINVGPGSFTGLKVGVSVANTLGQFLKIPVNSKKEIVEPKYE